MAAMMMTMMSFAKTQDFGGRVLDEKGEPMPYHRIMQNIPYFWCIPQLFLPL